MKKRRAMTWLGAGLLLVAAGAAIRAETSGWYGWRGHERPFGPRWYLTHELRLSDSQKKQIATIWRGERPQIAGMLRELAAENAGMQSAREAQDTGKLEDIASREGATIARLLKEKERMQSEIYSRVLDPDQRKKADAMLSRMTERLNGVADRIEKGGEHED